jgi:type 1 glutamine amidotransferase
MADVVIVSGGWPGHHPHETAALWAAELEQAGLRVERWEALDPLADPERLRGVRLVVPNWTMGELSDEQEAGLLAAVEAGTGLGGWHGGMGDAFRRNARYQFAVGGQFVAHPDDITTYRVDVVDRDHPATRGVTGFEVTSEQYYMHVDPGVHVLATTSFRAASAPWVNGTAMPAAWTHRYGDGRVFYCSVGHRPEDFGEPSLRRLVRQGLRWAARADL